MSRPVLVTLHGGCFVGGSAEWDSKQTAALRECGFDVVQLEFPRSNLVETLAWIRDAVASCPRPRLVLGRSSGGFLAKCLLDDGTFDRAAYLAPVFSPLLRAELVHALGTKAAPFFDTLQPVQIPTTHTWQPLKEALFLATHDSNVPDALFTPEQLGAAVRPGPQTHQGVITSTSTALLGALQSFFTTL